MSEPTAVAILSDSHAGHSGLSAAPKRLEKPFDAGPWTTGPDIAGAARATGRYLMKSIKVFSKAILLSGLVVFGSGMGRAETVSQSGSVTVIRGVDNAGSAEQRQESRGRLGIAVFRGASDPSGFVAAPAAPAMIAPQQVTGGRHLWILDPANGDVTACSVEYNFYGNRQVDCSSSR